jgi:hypothetical protein
MWHQCAIRMIFPIRDIIAVIRPITFVFSVYSKIVMMRRGIMVTRCAALTLRTLVAGSTNYVSMPTVLLSSAVLIFTKNIYLKKA